MNISFASNNHVMQIPESSLWFILNKEEILLSINTNLISIPTFSEIQSLNPSLNQQHYLGIHCGLSCFAASIQNPETTSLPLKLEFHSVRKSYNMLQNDQSLYLIIAKAKQLLYWDMRTQFCGCCGAKTKASETESAKICSTCKSLFFPPISPAILVLIWRNDEILLGRSSDFLPGIYSTLAGFVEPGETIEQAVVREVREEVGFNIKNLQYYSSQPWPFPSSLMIAFIAEYDGGELQIAHSELEDARWFSIKQLPQLPNQMSLSRQLIDTFVATRNLS